MLAIANMTIGALAEATGCTVPTVRYYEEIGLLPCATRKSGGHRVYGDDDVRRLLLIRRSRDFGFPIEQVRELLSLTDNLNKDCAEAGDIAQARLITVRKKLKEMRALEKSLSAFVERCSSVCAGGPASDCVILEELQAQPNAKCCGD